MNSTTKYLLRFISTAWANTSSILPVTGTPVLQISILPKGICWNSPANGPNLKKDRKYWNWAVDGVHYPYSCLQNFREAHLQFYRIQKPRKNILISRRKKEVSKTCALSPMI